MSSERERGGSKRRRESGHPSAEEEENPRVRIKTEIFDEDQFDEEDDPFGGPKTPELPRSSNCVDELAQHVKQERIVPSPSPGDDVDAGDVNQNEEVEAESEPVPSTSGSKSQEVAGPSQRSDGGVGQRLNERDARSEPVSSTSGSKRQREDPSTSSSSRKSSHPAREKIFKSEPVPNDMEWEDDDVTTNKEPDSGPNCEKDTADGYDGTPTPPPVSNFFTFTSTKPVQPLLPNAMTAGIQHQHVVQPQVAAYHTHAPEDQLNYVNDRDEKISTIPMFSESTAQDSDAESGGSGDEKGDGDALNQDGHGEKLTRYFRKNTVYTKYDFDSRKVDATRLAVHEKKSHILSTLDKNRVLIIEGFTGCGKTTQVPQYIMDRCRERKAYCNIVVTKPRKIAAISVAKRVCYERNWQLGSVVGYQVGMEAKRDRDNTLLTFMTTGVLLQKLISEKSLKEFTHIIIDEVHERDLESDFLLLVIKRLMSADVEGKERHVKLLLMSATIDTAKFERYFQFRSADGDIRGPPVIKIPFIVRHRVDEYYLDDLLSNKKDLLNMTESNMDREKAGIQEDIYDIAVSCMIALDDIEKDTDPDPRVRNQPGLRKVRGAVLVFLPGMEEIKRLQRALDQAKYKKAKDGSLSHTVDYKWAVYPLHSSVTAEDQVKVFDTAGATFRKIILSTNIAESSVTVPDIEYVIDFCLTKSLCVDETTNFTTLRMVWASKSQCVQRRGRAGRVADGKVYRLVPKSIYMSLEDQIIPEMNRSNLETVILMCKKFDLDCPRQLLGDALDPPVMSNIERAVATLKELGALTIVKEGRNFMAYDTTDGDLTFFGKVMAALPIPPQCTRLILFGHAFGVMREATIIAAGLSVKSPFQTGFQKQLDTYLTKMKHARRSFSDLFALYHVYKFWIINYCESGGSNSSKRQHLEYNWARGAMVNLSVLREIKSTVELLEERLRRLGIEDSYALQNDPSLSPVELSSEQGMFLKLAVAGAFYPNYFLRRRPDLRQYERDMNREVNGNDVFRTVYFKGFPPDHIGKLYAKHVADYLACGLSIPAVRFDGQKVFAIFDNSIGDTIGPFSTGMFRAIKLRQLRSENLEFKMLWKENERQALNWWEQSVRRRRCVPCPPLRELPPVDASSVKVRVQHILSPSQFWVIIGQDFNRVDYVFSTIQEHFIMIPLHESKLCPNCFCLAPFENVYYRAKVLRTENIGERQSLVREVYFVDYGNSKWVPSSVLSDFSPYMVDKGIQKMPCMAIECRLQELKPSIVHGLHWSHESTQLMRKFCDKAACLELKIFSVYQSMMVGELIGYGDPEGTKMSCSFNALLTKPNEDNKLYGETAPEPYLSMENRRKRDRSNYMERPERNAASAEQVGDQLDLDFVEPPRDDLRQPVMLKGPWSPLEMNFQALVHCSNTKEVRIDNNSVNSVLLDHEPTTSNSRMLVASHMAVADKSKAVTIRDSTIMSAIPGILQIVCMIFAPRVELRVDRNLTKYVGLLCGCGTVPLNPNNPNADPNMPVHPDDDMEIVFDTEIDDDDIDRINSIRYYLNNIFRNLHSANKSEHHKLLRDNVIKLLKRVRKKMDEEIWPQEEYVWNRVSEDCINTSVAPGMIFHHDDILPPHRKVKLNRVVVEDLKWDGVF